MAFNPTKEQECAINRDGSIIVSAAAGSGKTAVLVERVIRMLTNEEAPVMADKLLIVTFTNAAAAELSARIEKRLEEELAEKPDSLLIQKQHVLIPSAKICTIDSFCIDFMRENFEKIGISPSFKIADTPTLNSLQNKALAETFNAYFDANDKDFLKLLDFLGDDYDDSILQKTVLSVFEFSRHMPFPKLWFNSIIEKYKLHANAQSDEWFCGALCYAKDYAKDALNEIGSALRTLQLYEEAYEKYSDNFLYFEELANNIIDLIKTGSWDELYSLLIGMKAPALKRLSSELKTKEVLYALDLRDSAKDSIARIKNFIYASKAEIIEEIEYIYPFICKIIEIVNNFEARLYTALKDNDLITFYIAEQTALSLLAKEQNGAIVPVEDIRSFTEKYNAVLVDEYQDTNTLQDTLFNILSDNGKKLFCVGDVKQCIYKFRGSNPLNFLAKKQAAKNVEDFNGDTALRIDLGCNFRSRGEVCEYINSVFEKLIYNETSDFEYDNNEKLDPKAEYPQNTELKVENHFIDYGDIQQNSEEMFENKLEAEAHIVAEKIEEIVNKQPFLKHGKEALRKAKYSDIAILIRSIRGKEEIYIKAFKDRGIPVSVSASDVMESDEVNTLISLLKIISNPSDDIALLTVLTSQVFSFSMNELAEIRAAHKYGNFYSSVLAAAKNGNTNAAEFINKITKLRRRSVVLPLGILIDEIFEETNLLNIFSSRENSEVKRQNLLLIQNLAIDFDEGKNKDIHSFLNYFSSLENKDFSLSGSGSDGVKIMSVHKSKGLQFPICILANTANAFNERDLRDTAIVSEESGIALSFYNELGSKIDNNILRNLMKAEEKRSLLAEELRLFYVALTRTEELLLTFSAFDDLGAEIAKNKEKLAISKSTHRVEHSLFRKSSCYADWLIQTLLLDNKFDDDYLSNSHKVVIHKSVAQNSHTKELCAQNTFEATPEVCEELKGIYSYKYPFEELSDLQAKASVTDIVHKADEKEYRFKTRPAFMQSKGLSSAERGTAMHKVMQMANFEKCKTDFIGEVEKLHENLVLSDAEYAALDYELFKQFFESELCDRVIASNDVRREMKFLTEFPAGELLEDLSDNCKAEPIVVQGAVDLLFVENGQIVIVDFKSDRNKNEAELISAYKRQLEIYAMACSKLMNMQVKELIIYSYALGKEIIIK